MSQSVRTIIFLGVAVVCVGIGFATHSMYKPSDLEAFVDVGEPFYPKFEDPNTATGLRVASFNDDAGKTDVFSVENKNGLWQIPSHHKYPADGEEQLAQTAASMIGVKRQALIEKNKAAHKRYDLLDPLDKDVTGNEGRGDRITLYEGDEPLVDFIVGKKVEGQANAYYVRAANEDRFYTADLGEFSISTKFTDWINKDILDIERSAVREMIVNRYRIDEARGVLIQGDRLTLDRSGSSDPWKLQGLDEAKEELQTADVTALLTALDDLSIVGVRNKPPGISADLKAEPGKGISTTRFDMLDLQEKGFFIDPREGGGILSNEGEVLVGTDNGVLYVLRFGEEFSGSEVEIEVGSKAPKDNKPNAEKETPDAAKPDETEAGENEDSLVKSRYLFVTAQFDQSLLGEKPTPPVKPEEPAAESPEEKNEDAAAAENDDADEKAEEPVAKPDPQKEYEAALQTYNEEQEVYEIKLKNYNANVTKGKERVDELNRRFADWYYVISADVFDRMKINRDELVKAKEVPEEETAPEATTPELPGTPEKPEMKAPAANEKPAEPEKTEEAPAAPKDEKKPAEEKTTPPKDEKKPVEEKKPAKEEQTPKEDAKKPAEGKKPAESPPKETKPEEPVKETKPEEPAKETAPDSEEPAAESPASKGEEEPAKE